MQTLAILFTFHHKHIAQELSPVSDNSFLWHKRKSNPVVSFLLFYLQLSNICKNVAITEQAGLQSFCFSLMMEEHSCTYWIAHKALKGYPTKILSPCEGS